MVTADHYYLATEGALLIFLQSGVEKLLSWMGIELTALGFSS